MLDMACELLLVFQVSEVHTSDAVAPIVIEQVTVVCDAPSVIAPVLHFASVAMAA